MRRSHLPQPVRYLLVLIALLFFLFPIFLAVDDLVQNT